MPAYPVTLTTDSTAGGFVVTFADIPEAVTQGETLEEALAVAKEALESALDFYFEDKRPLPVPSVAREGQAIVVVPTRPCRDVTSHSADGR